ncbi:hypothetical protein ACFLYR_09585 [Chloroflexota bacterium]
MIIAIILVTIVRYPFDALILHFTIEIGELMLKSIKRANYPWKTEEIDQITMTYNPCHEWLANRAEPPPVPPGIPPQLYQRGLLDGSCLPGTKPVGRGSPEAQNMHQAGQGARFGVQGLP